MSTKSNPTMTTTTTGAAAAQATQGSAEPSPLVEAGGFEEDDEFEEFEEDGKSNVQASHMENEKLIRRIK